MSKFIPMTFPSRLKLSVPYRATPLPTGHWAKWGQTGQSRIYWGGYLARRFQPNPSFITTLTSFRVMLPFLLIFDSPR